MQNVDNIGHIVRYIASLNSQLSEFWGSVHGWAPIEVAELLSKSRLDRQIDFSQCLFLWLEPETHLTEGHLILAWANLGTLVEGTMKLYLSVWYESYIIDPRVIVIRRQAQKPDGLALELLRQFFEARFGSGWFRGWNAWITKIQYNRNAIHAFKDRQIGNFDELCESIKKYHDFLHVVNDRVPYPDDELYKPRCDCGSMGNPFQ